MSETKTKTADGPLPYPHKPVNRAGWSHGQWSSEPDVVTWVDEATGMHCAILRMYFNGALNGYVAVPRGSFLDGKSYSEKITPPPGFLERPVSVDEDIGVIPMFCAAVDEKDGTWALELLARCHGGLTYANRSDDGVWWFGFDTSHAGDRAPYSRLEAWRDGVYRNLAYVKAQCAKLAGDLAAINKAAEGRSDA